MTVDYKKLKALAEAATQGNWGAEGDDLFFYEDGYTKHLMETSEGSDICNDAEHPANLSFIAAANPATVLALLAEIERLDRESQNLSNQLGDCDRDRRAFRTERDQLKAENELMRALIGDAATDLRKASAWVCREVEAGTRSATHWAVRLRERADRLDAAMAKEASHDR